MKLEIGGGFQIRSFRAGDEAALARHADNLAVARHLEDRFPHPYTLRDAREWLARVAREDTPTHFAIATETEVVGGIGVQLRGDVYRATAELGYWLGESYWGRGTGTNAVRVITEWAFESFPIHRLQARVFEDNPASCRLLEKAGFTFEGRLRQSVLKYGQFMDQLVYAILRPEHEALK